MNIGEAGELSGLPAKTIRYYEEIGLVRPSARAENRYRHYVARDVEKLRFVKRAREFGFSVEQCRELLSLYEDQSRASAEVKAIAQQRIAEIERKIEELESLKRALSHLAAVCEGNERPDCPILDGLAA